MTLDAFKAELVDTIDDDNLLDFCRKRILHGTPFVFNDRIEDFYEFRKRIANEFSVSFHEVYITGSAQLGFSPRKGTEFSYDSDVDVSIVSTKLFEKIMGSVYKYQMELRLNRRAITERELKMYHDFLEYIAIGWMRPDKLPLSFQMSELKKDWFDFFKSISNGKSEVGNYKVAAGVFRDYSCLEQYTLSGIKEIRTKEHKLRLSYD